MASFTPTFSSSSLDDFPIDSGTNGSSSPCPQKMGTELEGDPRIYQSRVKDFNYQNETVHSYLFDLVLDGEPPAKNGETGELVLGRESGSQGHCPTLTEPANNNPIRGDTIVDLLCDELIYLIPGLEDPRFVLWTFEPETEDIKPNRTS